MNKLIIQTLMYIVGSVFPTLNAAELISRKAIQNDLEFNLHASTTSPSPITILLNDKNMDGSWKLEIKSRYGYYRDIDCLEAHQGYCVIEPVNFEWNEAYRDFEPETNRDYFDFKLTFSDNAGNEDEVLFKWGLLPSRPVLSDVEFTYQYDWNDDMIFPNGYFSFAVESKNSDRYWLNITDSFLFGPPFFFIVCFTFDSSSHDRIGYDAEWGEFVDVGAQNKFGFVHSDTLLFTTDYITDREVLDRIQSIRDNTHVEAINANPTLDWDNEKISFGRNMMVDLFDLSGNLILSEKNTSLIFLTDLPKGIYIVIYRDDQNIYKSKIFKK